MENVFEYSINLILFFLGDTIVLWEQNAGRCGVCGDAFNSAKPRLHEAGGIYAKGIISKFYTAGQVSLPLYSFNFA